VIKVLSNHAIHLKCESQRHTESRETIARVHTSLGSKEYQTVAESYITKNGARVEGGGWESEAYLGKEKWVAERGGFSSQHTETCLPAARLRGTTPTWGSARQWTGSGARPPRSSTPPGPQEWPPAAGNSYLFSRGRQTSVWLHRPGIRPSRRKSCVTQIYLDLY